MTETAEAILERQRAQARERKRRFDERHPERGKAYKARYRRATATLRDRHRDEFLLIAAAKRREGVTYQKSYRAAGSELRSRYPDEWADVLAATS